MRRRRGHVGALYATESILGRKLAAVSSGRTDMARVLVSLMSSITYRPHCVIARYGGKVMKLATWHLYQNFLKGKSEIRLLSLTNVICVTAIRVAAERDYFDEGVKF